MKLHEILIELEILDIIIKVGEEYHITDKYKTVLKNPKEIVAPSKIVEDKKRLFNSVTIERWPKEIESQEGRAKVVALLDYLEVPLYGETNGNKYRIRSMDNNTIQTMVKLIEKGDPTIISNIIRDYYSTGKGVKNFKNFVTEDFEDMYYEYLEGNVMPKKSEETEGDKPNQTWG